MAHKGSKPLIYLPKQLLCASKSLILHRDEIGTFCIDCTDTPVPQHTAALGMISFTYMRSEADCVWRALPRASEAADRRAREDTRMPTLLTTIDFYLV
jgi:hypothetical protein